MGRPPIGKCAMEGAERQRRYMERLRASAGNNVSGGSADFAQGALRMAVALADGYDLSADEDSFMRWARGLSPVLPDQLITDMVELGQLWTDIKPQLRAIFGQKADIQ